MSYDQALTDALEMGLNDRGIREYLEHEGGISYVKKFERDEAWRASQRAKNPNWGRSRHATGSLGPAGRAMARSTGAGRKACKRCGKPLLRGGNYCSGACKRGGH